MSEPLHWSKKTADYATGVTLGAMFFVVFGLMMDDLIWGAALGVAWFLAFSAFSENAKLTSMGKRFAWWKTENPHICSQKTSSLWT